MSVEIALMGRSPFADFTARLEEGEILFRAGDPAQTLFVVQTGAIETFRASPTGEGSVTVMEKGDFFGETSLLEGTPRTFSARARCSSTVIEIGTALFDRMIRSNVELAVRMLRKLSQRLAAAEMALDQGTGEKEISPPSTASTPAAPTVLKPLSEDRSAARLVSAATGTTGRQTQTSGDVFLVNPRGPEVFPLTVSNQPLRVGRFDPVTSIRPEVDLTLMDLKRSVSRRHATLTRAAAGFQLTEEVGALNGTQVNGTMLSPGEPIDLHDGDQICFGSVSLAFRTSPPEDSSSAD